MVQSRMLDRSNFKRKRGLSERLFMGVYQAVYSGFDVSIKTTRQVVKSIAPSIELANLNKLLPSSLVFRDLFITRRPPSFHKSEVEKVFSGGNKSDPVVNSVQFSGRANKSIGLGAKVNRDGQSNFKWLLGMNKRVVLAAVDILLLCFPLVILYFSMLLEGLSLGAFLGRPEWTFVSLVLVSGTFRDLVHIWKKYDESQDKILGGSIFMALFMVIVALILEMDFRNSLGKSLVSEDLVYLVKFTVFCSCVCFFYLVRLKRVE